MDRNVEMAVEYFLHLRTQVSDREAMFHTLVRYDVDRADILAALAGKVELCIST